MTDKPTPSGRDLARQALADYKASTWAVPSRTSRPAKRRRPLAPADRRDPVSLGAALRDVSADPTWDSALQGGGIRDQWATIAPELVGKVAAESFDPATRILALRPASSAYATQLRLLGPQLVARINAAAGAGAVRSLRVLPPRALPGASVLEPETLRLVAAAEREPRTRADAAPGYHRALEALEAARADTDTAEPGQEARDRWFGDIRGTLREPEPAAPPTALHRPSSVADDARARALEFKRAEKTGRAIPGVRRLGETA